ncbi:F0F1 ATP synthase subunit gamma [Mumia sp. zg.B53]|uniref:F0F1 ATP synthase subunit gamma n=1 Tax=unclassified Mumia TaxID=2621872 RepID=UPI001C6F5021|nr:MULTISPECIES: F0F1 ATP synthase subunit gamma [unclassified Mumia]MBW9206592.1 F0F1 ATP synthase subunit gamma [Mumia sp. zg.B17]MBW9211118.1 F0F1 ATP synthase subunit gamma [Mumia sp. zg.B21]MBW9215686.1 F0F1 ATP synthase subunit gamma [Mumia sp. zg.B53]MDD9347832.1 F0F1 ATP synthase subunit gamma [Mumia sp.]
MATSLREYRAKIKSTQSMKKITRAMELIAASRIVKAQQQAAAATPYARELTRAVSALATFGAVDHKLLTENPEPKRAAVLVIASDRGLAGSYSSAVLKESERLVEKLHAEGKDVDMYVTGRKAEAYFRFRQRPVVQSWTGFSDHPSYADAREVGDVLTSAFLIDPEDPETGDPEREVDELHVVFTRFRSMISQTPEVIRLLPLEVVEGEEPPAEGEVYPLYEFEPSASEVLDGLLPKYVNHRLYFCFLQAAASELAARQQAMKNATDNAEDLIQKYTRTANQARQAGITQEISEIVGGANALADATAGSE